MHVIVYIYLRTFMHHFFFQGRGMNAAFAIGRLLDTRIGKDRLINDSDTEKMVIITMYVPDESVQVGALHSPTTILSFCIYAQCT